MNKEPVAIITAIVAAISIGISTAVEFGLELTDTQTSALNKLITALAGIAIIVFARPRVTPVSKDEL